MKRTKTINKQIVLFAMILLGLVGCQSQELPAAEYEGTNAVILGRDLRLCACCGGYLVSFVEDSTALTADTYQWYQSNGDFGISDTLPFPLPVTITYALDSTLPCGTLGRISITALSRR